MKTDLWIALGGIVVTILGLFVSLAPWTWVSEYKYHSWYKKQPYTIENPDNFHLDKDKVYFRRAVNEGKFVKVSTNRYQFRKFP